MMNDDDDDLILDDNAFTPPAERKGDEYSYADVLRELVRVETKIAERYNITGQPRREILRRVDACAIPEDELVTQWHELYGTYTRWLAREPDWRRVDRRNQEAAQSAASLVFGAGAYLLDLVNSLRLRLWRPMLMRRRSSTASSPES